MGAVYARKRGSGFYPAVPKAYSLTLTYWERLTQPLLKKLEARLLFLFIKKPSLPVGKGYKREQRLPCFFFFIIYYKQNKPSQSKPR